MNDVIDFVRDCIFVHPLDEGRAIGGVPTIYFHVEVTVVGDKVIVIVNYSSFGFPDLPSTLISNDTCRGMLSCASTIAVSEISVRSASGMWFRSCMSFFPECSGFQFGVGRLFVALY